MASFVLAKQNLAPPWHGAPDDLFAMTTLILGSNPEAGSFQIRL
jgi:hypothetical protein